jgi:hypothetical protein
MSTVKIQAYDPSKVEVLERGTSSVYSEVAAKAGQLQRGQGFVVDATGRFDDPRKLRNSVSLVIRRRLAEAGCKFVDEIQLQATKDGRVVVRRLSAEELAAREARRKATEAKTAVKPALKKPKAKAK